MQSIKDRALRRAARLAATLAVIVSALGASSAEALEGPLLSPPGERLDDVVPLRVLDDLAGPSEPPRVAAKSPLSWRPGLGAAAKELAAGSVAPPAGGAIDEATPSPGAATSAAPATAGPGKAPPPKAHRPRAEPAKAEPATAKPRDAALKPLLAAPRLVSPTVDPAPAATTAPASPRLEAPKAEERATEDSSPDTTSPVLPERIERPGAVAGRPLAAPTGIAPAPAAPAGATLSRSMRSLRTRLRTVLSFYYRKPLNTLEHDPWELMHGMLAYELHSRVHDGGPNGPLMTAVGHLCYNRPSKRQQMMLISKDGRLDVQVGVGLQGHKGQFLAMLAQCNVSPDYPIRVDGREFTVRDLVAAEQRTCVAKTELTFKLIGLGHYLASDATWTNDQGETWDIPRLIREEREQPIRGAACGGTHRLSALSLAFRRREARDEPVDGEYAEAAKLVAQHQAYCFGMQNEDGSLSTEWFRARGAEDDPDRRLRTSGHQLEWLVYSLPDDQLTSHRTVRTVNYLVELLAGRADHDWHLGSIGHALHALVLYDKRVFRPHDPDAARQVVTTVDPTAALYRAYPVYRGVMRNSPPESSGLFGIFGGGRASTQPTRRR